MKRDEGLRQLRAGIFLVGAVILMVAAVVILGRSHAIFTERVRLHTWFANTSGLTTGAPVRLAGVDVGQVQAIRFAPDPRQKKVRVTLAVERRYLDRIREDSVARLSSRGLLGDTLVDISVGSLDAPPLGPGGELTSAESDGLNEIIASVQAGINEVRALSQTVRERLELVFTEDLARDVGRTAHAAAAVAERLQNGPGLAHTLIYDPALAADARSLVNKTDRLVDRVDRVLVQVEKGPGTLHDLVYRDQGTRLVAELARAAEETRQVIGEIRTGKGLLHTLIYEEDKGNLLDNLTALSRTLRKIGDEVAEGKGTVGALLKDPSVYEDLKTILGNIRRSRFLRSLVRFTIKRQDLKAE
jgi:phospholipid/cholesterol/gamma-HCH transport system substrate-binding protein